MHLACLRRANLPQRQNRLAELASLRRAGENEACGQQNRWASETHVTRLLRFHDAREREKDGHVRCRNAAAMRIRQRVSGCKAWFVCPALEFLRYRRCQGLATEHTCRDDGVREGWRASWALPREIVQLSSACCTGLEPSQRTVSRALIA